MIVDLLSCSKVWHINKCPLTIGKNEISKNSQQLSKSTIIVKLKGYTTSLTCYVMKFKSMYFLVQGSK